MIKKFILLIFCIATLVSDLPASGIEDMRGLDLKNVKIPFYDEGTLQLMIFSSSGKRYSQQMISDNTFLDMLLKDADVDKIPDGWDTALYRIGAAMPEVLKFWKIRHQISDAVIYTPRCTIDQQNSQASGNARVSLRSPLFDLDGIGFNVDFKNQVIEIKSDVNILVRSSDLDPRKIHTGAKLPEQHRVITASGDALRLDRKNNEIMLIGNVKVVDGKNRMTCSRLTVYMDPNGQKNSSLTIANQDEKAVLDGVKRVLADGDVELIQYPDSESTDIQRSNSDHLEYDIPRGLIILTGEKRNPVLSRGKNNQMELSGKRIELLRHEDKMFVFGECRIFSKTFADDRKTVIENRTVSADRANFDGRTNIANFHGNVKAADNTTGIQADSIRIALSEKNSDNDNFKINSVLGNGNVRIKSQVLNPDKSIAYTRTIAAENADYDGKNNIVNFIGKVVAMDQTSKLQTDHLRVHLVRDKNTSHHKINLLFGNGNVKITSRSEKAVAGQPDRKKLTVSTINSYQAVLDYQSNKLIFYKDVKVRDNEASLDCGRLDIFLADKTVSPGKTMTDFPSGAPLAAGMEGKDKTVTKMIAVDKVEMISDRDQLNTDKLTLSFQDLPTGAKPSPGMIQSGGVQLAGILCEGSVIATSEAKQDGRKYQQILKADLARSNLLTDFSEFHGNVEIYDNQTEIYCRDMYITTGQLAEGDKIVDQKIVSQQKTLSEEEQLDADPFAMDMGENSVPSRIAIASSRHPEKGPQRELKQIICENEVVLLRRDKKNKLQRAGGDKAVYTVETREIILTANSPRRPWLRSDGRKQFCDIIKTDLATEDLRAIGNVEIMPDNE